MKKNRLRELLNEGKPTLGTHVITPWPGIVEIIGHSGAFDYIEYVGEYSAFSLEQLDNFGRTIELFPNISSMMKVEEQSRGFIATREIDAGIQNVLFADCRSAEEVRECIRLVRPETPESGGTHGCKMRRNVGYVLEVGTETWTKAMNEVVIAIRLGIIAKAVKIMTSFTGVVHAALLSPDSGVVALSITSRISGSDGIVEVPVCMELEV